jgi:hypothetical protein
VLLIEVILIDCLEKKRELPLNIDILGFTMTRSLNSISVD